MTIHKPRRFGEWVRFFSPALIMIGAMILAFYAERWAPRQGLTGFTVMLAGLVPSMVISIAMGCWMLRVGPKDDFGKAVKGGLIGLGVLALNGVIALPGIIVIAKLLRPVVQ